MSADKLRVVVGMSGGVDSSLAAALLAEQGHDVIGVTIKTWEYDDVGGNKAADSSCCSLDGIGDARRVCSELGIPHYVFDFSEEFRLGVIDPFVESYLEGLTPNPCVLCNRRIKWERLIRKALGMGADRVAMGHYAAVLKDADSGRWHIARGGDSRKDQSYALWGLSQESLSRTVFPLADMSKSRARAEALRLGLHIASKRESYEICFIPDDDYPRFLKQRVQGLEERVKGGAVEFEGRRIGAHDGYPFYTIGQRRGLRIAAGEPLYVTGIDPGSNTVRVGRESDLLSRGFIAGDVNMQKHPFPSAPMRVSAKIRYKDPGAPATLIPLEDGRIEVRFDEARRAVTPGQSTVWYEGEDVVGGGVIRRR